MPLFCIFLFADCAPLQGVRDPCRFCLLCRHIFGEQLRHVSFRSSAPRKRAAVLEGDIDDRRLDDAPATPDWSEEQEPLAEKITLHLQLHFDRAESVSQGHEGMPCTAGTANKRGPTAPVQIGRPNARRQRQRASDTCLAASSPRKRSDTCMCEEARRVSWIRCSSLRVPTLHQ